MGFPSGDVTFIQKDSSRIGAEKSRYAVKCSGLAGAIRPDQGMNVSPRYFQVDAIYRTDSAKRFGQSTNYERVRHGDIQVRPKMPTSPRGNAKTTRTKTNPNTNCHA
jgi:hypothetical protein